jgi:predicted amidohydrolase YtcJ
MMRSRISAWLCGAALLSALAAGPSGAAETNRQVFLHGQIYTPQGFVEAMLVADGKIVSLGSDAAVEAAAGPDAKVVDLAGRTVMPGLHDMHVHPMEAGFTLQECHIAQGVTGAETLAAVTACAKAAAPGQWIFGGQWEAIAFGGAPPNRRMLDEIAPNNPVFLYDISGHSAWVNSEALKLAGITRATPNPPSGLIERDAAGEPTGILRENATSLVGALIPPGTRAQNAAALKKALSILLSFGVTELTDAMVGKEELTAYDDLSDQGLLKQRVRACIAYGKMLGKGVEFDTVLAERATYTRPRFKADCVKVFMDGVPTDSHTAAMLEPYASGLMDGDKDRARVRGLLLVPPAELNPLVARIDKMGVTMKFHSVGDRATRTVMDAIEAARKANGPNGPQHDAGHLTFVSSQDLARAKGLNVALEFSPYLWYPTSIDDDIIKAIGPERIKRVWPVREGLESGALVVAGSDWEVVPSADPWIGIETLVTRTAPDNARPGESFGPDEAITLKQAIDIFTINAAKHMGDSDRLGSLETNKIADFIVLDRNPFKISIKDVHKVKVLAAYINGERVYDGVPPDGAQ